MPEESKKALRLFLSYRAAVAEIELREKLAPFMHLFAKAAVAYSESEYNTDVSSQWRIGYTDDLIGSARLALDAELSDLL